MAIRPITELSDSPDTQLLDERIAQALDQAAKAGRIETGGGGDHTGGMDAWQQSVENRLTNLDRKIDRNFTITWGGIIGLGLIGVGGFAWMVTRLFGIERELGEISATLLAILDKLP